MAGEPEWAFGMQELPQHVQLLLRLQSALPWLFDGIHLDVEPNALQEWSERSAKLRLIEGTVKFYGLIRRTYPNIPVDAAVNPVFSGLQTADGRNFLRQIASATRSVSLLGYRNRIDSLLDWTRSSVAQLNGVEARWRMGVEVEANTSEPITSWSRVPRQQFMSAMAVLDARLRSSISGRNY